ncbi:MFS transporter [Brevibacillus sp. SYSU BS000544]|uniref:MFS transporter n=1 Tax=Brevibacillus sp. SYSU BS000544 TaxID=3416443 RepID=UPI003CE47B2A
MTSIWKNRSFVSLWLAQVASNIGDQFYSIALLWYLLQQTKSASALSLIAIPDMVAGFLFYLIGGILADRYNPRTLMIGADMARLILAAVVSSLVLMKVDHLFFFLAIQFGIGVFSTLFHPSRTVALKAVVPLGQLQQANAILDTTFRTIRIAAPMTIGVIASVLPLAVLFFANALSYFLSAIFIYLLNLSSREQGSVNHKQPSKASVSQYLSDIRSAAKEVLSSRFLLYLLLFNNMGFLVWQVCWSVGFPVLADQIGKGDAGMLGILVGCYGVGNLMGSLFMTRFTYQNHLLVILSGWLLQAVGFISLSLFIEQIHIVYVAAAIAGLGGPLIGIPPITAIQTRVTNENTGKVFALNMLVFTFFCVVSSSLGALWLGELSIKNLFMLSGLYLLITIIGGYFVGRRVWSKSAYQENHQINM